MPTASYRDRTLGRGRRRRHEIGVLIGSHHRPSGPTGGGVFIAVRLRARSAPARSSVAPLLLYSILSIWLLLCLPLRFPVGCVDVEQQPLTDRLGGCCFAAAYGRQTGGGEGEVHTGKPAEAVAASPEFLADLFDRVSGPTEQ